MNCETCRHWQQGEPLGLCAHPVTVRLLCLEKIPHAVNLRIERMNGRAGQTCPTWKARPRPQTTEFEPAENDKKEPRK